MARKRVRIERGLYRDGAIYYACATPPGSRSAVWRSLGTVGKMEARRLRDESSPRPGEVRLNRRRARVGVRPSRTLRQTGLPRSEHSWASASSRLEP